MFDEKMNGSAKEFKDKQGKKFTAYESSAPRIDQITLLNFQD